ncbi:uncharacterized protein LOC116133679 [Pistacia vera]|uniref:uncharacterized protein LOC116133679 n=1 Tax=Pistacia vera TaxID=55513 RepID=UPI00126345EA|nr:uncharacterized protein LOC116133679 [Pistacia vera]
MPLKITILGNVICSCQKRNLCCMINFGRWWPSEVLSGNTCRKGLGKGDGGSSKKVISTGSSCGFPSLILFTLTNTLRWLEIDLDAIGVSVGNLKSFSCHTGFCATICCIYIATWKYSYSCFAAARDGRGISNYTQFNSSCNGASCNVSLDDKRGVPSGSNPLHNR